MISSPWGHDYAWERAVVRKIREGGAAPEVYALYEGDPSPMKPATAPDSRRATSSITRARLQNAPPRTGLLRASVRAAQEAAKERNAAEAARKKDTSRVAPAISARRRERRARRRAREVAEGSRRAARGISPHARNLRSPRASRTPAKNIGFIQTSGSAPVCGGKIVHRAQKAGYQITCMSCEKSAWGSHKSLWDVLNK